MPLHQISILVYLNIFRVLGKGKSRNGVTVLFNHFVKNSLGWEMHVYADLIIFCNLIQICLYGFKL